jgi:hypothetical protein
MRRLKITGWDAKWTVEALLHLLQDTHKSRVAWEKKAISTTFFVTVEGPDEAVCVRRLETFCLSARWRISDA